VLTGVEHRGQLRQRPAGGRLWLAAQRADGGPQAENTANEARSSGLLDESTTSAVANSSPTTEALTAQAADPRTQLEATANSLFSSSLLAEFIATALADGGTPTEALAGQRGDAVAQAEAIAGIMRDLSAINELVTAVLADSPLADEYKSAFDTIVSRQPLRCAGRFPRVGIMVLRVVDAREHLARIVPAGPHAGHIEQSTANGAPLPSA